MKWNLNRTITLAILLLAIGLIFVISGTLEPKVTVAGDTAPNFSIVTDDGKTITRDNFGGKILVLNFWASWCGPCIDEAPSLEEFSKAMAPKGVVVVGVSVDGNQKLYEKFKQRFGITFETARDPESNLSSSYGTFLIPESYFIDRNGKVLEKIVSNPANTWMDPDLLARVNRLLASAPTT